MVKMQYPVAQIRVRMHLKWLISIQRLGLFIISKMSSSNLKKMVLSHHIREPLILIPKAAAFLFSSSRELHPISHGASSLHLPILSPSSLIPPSSRRSLLSPREALCLFLRKKKQGQEKNKRRRREKKKRRSPSPPPALFLLPNHQGWVSPPSLALSHALQGDPMISRAGDEQNLLGTRWKVFSICVSTPTASEIRDFECPMGKIRRGLVGVFCSYWFHDRFEWLNMPIRVV